MKSFFEFWKKMSFGPKLNVRLWAKKGPPGQNLGIQETIEDLEKEEWKHHLTFM